MGDARKPVDGEGRPKVRCLECGNYFHDVGAHVVAFHAFTVKRYLAAHPGAPLLSDFASTRRASPVEDDRAFSLGAARLRQRLDVGEADSALVPKFDPLYSIGVREMTQWEGLALAIEAGENALLVGDTGAGKSTCVLQLAAALGQPVQRKNLHGDIRAADFIGEKTIEVDKESGQAVVRWSDGMLPRAMRAGHWLLLDEVDAAPPEILFVLQGVLEPHGALVLPGNGGEVVSPDENFRVIATANTLGRGDESGLYAGTNVLNEAFLDRFGVVIECAYPPEDEEIAIVVGRTGVKAETAKKMVSVARMVREQRERDGCYTSFSTRRLVAWASKAKRMGNVRAAADLAVLNRVQGVDRGFVRGVLDRVFPATARVAP